MSRRRFIGRRSRSTDSRIRSRAELFEVDHLIPLELGGDNSIANLWPEAAEPTPGFHEKDRVENYLHRRVCEGAMSLADAQRQVATDWVRVWRQMEGQPTTTDEGPSDGE